MKGIAGPSDREERPAEMEQLTCVNGHQFTKAQGIPAGTRWPVPSAIVLSLPRHSARG